MSSAQSIPFLLPEASSTQERLITILGGPKLFLDHPIFGAGLGAFRSEMILNSEGISLINYSTRVLAAGRIGSHWIYRFYDHRLVHFCQGMAECQPGSGLGTDCTVPFRMCGHVRPGDMLNQRTFWLLLGAGLAMSASAKPRKDISALELGLSELDDSATTHRPVSANRAL